MTIILYSSVFVHSFFPKFKDLVRRILVNCGQNQVTPVEEINLNENRNENLVVFNVSSPSSSDHVRYLLHDHDNFNF